MADQPQDAVDRHVLRWRDHWIDVPAFDDEVEGIVTRIGKLAAFLRHTTKAAAAETGLEYFEYSTLHSLMVSETPGVGSPGSLAADLDVSPAGITGRLDALEKAGYLKRKPGAGDRRRIEVEATRSGADAWRRTMALRAAAETRLTSALSKREQRDLNRLLRKLMLVTESDHDG